MKPNPGHLPTDAMGKRVRGELENGMPFAGWPADGSGACNWRRTGHPFEIARYEVVA
ncbi:hypothetical protein SAMN05192583_1015 [Sphingomonas gellani]|uniref:Uncharacterized protein n=1 Tax=Sphingomonas gellani TaxID=1166340 RepID=A0A1H8AQ91_9SPHN|nr:hypothetical protein [Sphingomonas gellani]SEM72891.1 hypothetical protein SAMN05192583_1015 [Sphingomonas gellani]